MQLQPWMSIGDLIVSGSVVISILVCYHALKNLIEKALSAIRDVQKTVATHQNELNDHAEQLAALNAQVFGRRSRDRYSSVNLPITNGDDS